MHPQIKIIALCSVAMILASACGTKGPLYLPTKKNEKKSVQTVSFSYEKDIAKKYAKVLEGV
jgi:predicted small lipoprotein YifL